MSLAKSIAKLGKSKFLKIARFLLVFVLVTGWIFSGWPQIWHSPPFPPEVQEAQAAVAFVAAGSFAGNATVATQAITAPACSANDILIAVVINKELNTTISAPDVTWTQIYQANGDCTTAADDHRTAKK